MQVAGWATISHKIVEALLSKNLLGIVNIAPTQRTAANSLKHYQDMI